MILDVRESDEFAEEHIPGSLNIPLTVFTSLAPDALKDVEEEVIIMCRSGRRAFMAKEIIAQMDLMDINNVHVFEGGILKWRDEGKPTEKGHHRK